MTLAPGTRLGPYEIVAPLGAGGMGEVWRARDPRLGRDVAIKALPVGFARDPERRARFEREAQTLASLSHPNIAAIYGLEDAGGLPHLVLELVEGESLAARLARGALPMTEAIAVCIQVASAIEAAHERGIVHRDLKPGNVMLKPDGAAKVLDFGLAKSDPAAPSDPDLSASPTLTAHAGATVAGTILGTAAYMSPEQARGTAVDRRTDVWSFGCVLFECLVGRAAFEGATATDLLARILEREPDWSLLPATVPPRVRNIVRRCLRKDAAERPRDIRDVRLELASSLAGGAKGDAAHEKSIAVLPFNNLSGPDDEYFADGITDEILNALAQLEGVRVAARTSCFAFKGRREDLRQVGEKLDVATVLEGTVRRSGSRLRITVQLVNAADGYQLWSERYDREMTDVFEVQDEIAGAIASRLLVTMRGDADRARGTAGTRNVEAYDLYHRGRGLLYRRGGSVLGAIRCFEQAIALDPGYADALASLADSYRLQATYGAAAAFDVMPRARAAAEQALAIEPDHPEALCTLADVELQFDRRVERGMALWERATERHPRFVRARCERALWLAGTLRWTSERAVEETAIAAADEPLNAWVAGMRAYLLAFAGRHEEAIAEAERGVAIDPESFLARVSLMQAHAWAGNHARALELGSALLATSGRHVWVLGTLAWIHGRTGDPDRSRSVFDELEARSRHEYVPPGWLVVAAASAGLEDAAQGFMQRLVEERDPMAMIASLMPQFDVVRAHAGLDRLLREAVA